MPGSQNEAPRTALVSGIISATSASSQAAEGVAEKVGMGGRLDSVDEGKKRTMILEEYLRGRSRVCLGFDSDTVLAASGQIHVGMIIDVKKDLSDDSFIILMVPELPPGSSFPDTLKQIVLNRNGTLNVSGYIKTADGSRIRAFPHEDSALAMDELRWLNETFAELRGRSAEPIAVPAFLQPYQGRAF